NTLPDTHTNSVPTHGLRGHACASSAVAHTHEATFPHPHRRRGALLDLARSLVVGTLARWPRHRPGPAHHHLGECRSSRPFLSLCACRGRSGHDSLAVLHGCLWVSGGWSQREISIFAALLFPHCQQPLRSGAVLVLRCINRTRFCPIGMTR